MQPIPENGPIHTAADARIPPLTEVYQTVHLKEFTDFPKKDEKDPTTVFTDIHFVQRLCYDAVPVGTYGTLYLPLVQAIGAGWYEFSRTLRECAACP